MTDRTTQSITFGMALALLAFLAVLIAVIPGCGDNTALPDSTVGAEHAECDAGPVPLPECPAATVSDEGAYCSGCYDAQGVPQCDQRDDLGRVVVQTLHPHAECQVTTPDGFGNRQHVVTCCPDARSNSYGQSCQ